MTEKVQCNHVRTSPLSEAHWDLKRAQDPQKAQLRAPRATSCSKERHAVLFQPRDDSATSRATGRGDKLRFHSINDIYCIICVQWVIEIQVRCHASIIFHFINE